MIISYVLRLFVIYFVSIIAIDYNRQVKNTVHINGTLFKLSIDSKPML